MGMKCIRCDTDNNLSDRNLNRGLCKNCRHPFVFEPAIMEGVKLTDQFFANAIQYVSADNSLYFTPKQLFYLLRKRLYKTPKLNQFSAGVIFGLFILLYIEIVFFKEHLGYFVYSLFVIGVTLNLIYRILKSGNSRIDALNEEQLQEWLNAWLQVNDIPKLLSFASAAPSLTPVNSDISAYSFDRAIICDTDAIAQFLIANNFHFENNCAILSITGYPQSIFDTVMQMLRRNPELKVYAIHDANPSGVSLVHRLRTSPDWFANSNVTIYELGLLPRQISSNRNLFVQISKESAQQAKQLPAPVRESLSPNELKWLEKGKYLALESFSPRRIIRILNQGIIRSQEPNLNNSLVEIDEGGYGSGGYAYTLESFG